MATAFSCTRLLGSSAGRVATALLIGALATGPGGATVLPDPDVPAMTAAADLIAVGRAQGAAVHRGTANTESFVVAVDRVLKGSLASAQVPVRLVLAAAGSSTVENGAYGIFFLRRTAQGPYFAADPYHPALAAAPKHRPGVPTAADPLAAVADELTAVLAAVPATLTASPDPADAQWIQFDAAAELQTIPYAAAAAALRGVAAAKRLPAQLWAISCILNMAGKEELKSAAAAYLAAVQSALLDPGADAEFAAAAIARSMPGRVSSPQAVPTIATLLGSKQVTVRRAAANTLADIADAGVVRPLAKVALNDDDEDVRYYAVRGLAAATHAAAVPAIAGFRQTESESLQFWRNWARRLPTP